MAGLLPLIVDPFALNVDVEYVCVTQSQLLKIVVRNSTVK